MAKKLMATLIVVAILFAAVPLSVSAADEYYTEKESNNSFVYANRIDSGYTVVGEIYSADKDFYAFRVPYTATVTVAAISLYGSLSLCLYNTNEVVAVAQNTGGIEEYWSYSLSCIVEEGLYYLVFTDSQSYYMNTYAFAMVYERYDHTHSYTATTVAPTCTEQGYTEYTCACGDYYYDNYTDPTHTYSNAMDTSCNACDYVRILSDGWAKVNGRWVYYQNGRVATNRWIKDSTGWCYVGADGYVVTDCWKKDSKGWCYLNQSG